MAATSFTPGTIINARNREWMVIGLYDKETLRVRPINGSEEDQILINLEMEQTPVTSASFPLPKMNKLATQEAALLLRDSLLLSLRRGAGPFRSFGSISIEPRAYQLVPLMLALKQSVVRLLIADDVGIGKTIEACLIAKEFHTRGEIDRFTVLCPPHLVDQWLKELDRGFHFKTVAVTSGTASKLEKNLPPGESIFTAYPFTVVSLDYIKSDRRRNEFLRACPEFVIVDEAHSCSGANNSKHQRFELLSKLSEDEDRHMVYLTATPHSGDENAFFRLLGLLNEKFLNLQNLSGIDKELLRDKLRNHFIQRRRSDISEWQAKGLFPERKTKELTYRLSGEWLLFFQEILKYCLTATEGAGSETSQENVLSTLSLLRSASSSPAAAVQALKNKIENSGFTEAEELEDSVFDGDVDNLMLDDTVPNLKLKGAVKNLIKAAELLQSKDDDPKLKCLIEHIAELKSEGFSPVVFCRFIPTVHYLKKQLEKHFKKSDIGAVTGEYSSDDREKMVLALGEKDDRILIASDCLSEGVNLQEHFNAVVHYDLSWNPTRHEQREGRVDRYGQPKDEVRATLMYGENNAVDSAILRVILRKAESIRKELGVPVPLPDNSNKLKKALLEQILFSYKKKNPSQLSFDLTQYDKQQSFKLDELEATKEIDSVWKNASENAKKSKSIFAQQSLKPDEVMPELERNMSFIGGKNDVVRFTLRALARIGATAEKIKDECFRFPFENLPEIVKGRLESDGFDQITRISFTDKPIEKYINVKRNHPLIHSLADNMLEYSLTEINDDKVIEGNPSFLGRTGCWISSNVSSKTAIVLIRLRYQLSTEVRGKKRVDLVEEALCVGWQGNDLERFLLDAEALKILSHSSDAEPPEAVKKRLISQTLEDIIKKFSKFEEFALARSQEILKDHDRVKAASKGKGILKVDVVLPPDLIAVYVVLPKIGT